MASSFLVQRVNETWNLTLSGPSRAAAASARCIASISDFEPVSRRVVKWMLETPEQEE